MVIKQCFIGYLFIERPYNKKYQVKICLQNAAKINHIIELNIGLNMILIIFVLFYGGNIFYNFVSP